MVDFTANWIRFLADLSFHNSGPLLQLKFPSDWVKTKRLDQKV